MLARKPRTGLVAATAIVAMALLAGCSVTTENDAAAVAVGAGSIKKDPALAGKTIAVGSKDFTENILLGHLTMMALKAAGANVENRTNIKGSVNSRKALVAGEVDVSWEYTGTAWITYLNHADPIPDAKGQYEAVIRQDKQRNNVVWAAPAPANNTYSLAVREDKAKEWNLKTFSDLAAFVKSHPADATFCLESEFANRNDGWPGMTKAYGMSVPPANVRTVDTGVVYTETKKGQACSFGEVFTTDGRINNLKLVPLIDDKRFFPIYNPALTVNGATAAKYPGLVKLLDPITARLDDATLRRLNEQVDVKGELASTVAADWMRQQGFIG
ncbi:MAG TPA: glycine betaine ABC transporter substrate-binding protein [Planosporangium sp.]|jgi:osmoprotectant transport system substrate-binding protein|nr:glycine betaine ABC transporter substrate-binding protein [Planosporangium sp.]